jgi:hypothetical protein
MDLLPHESETEENSNWLSLVSKRKCYVPEVICANYQPLGMSWCSKPIDHRINDRKLNQIVSVKSFRGKSVLFLGGWDPLSGRRYNDLHEMDESGNVFTRRRACEWSARCRFHALTSRRNDSKIFIIGGDDGTKRSDTWLSVNGGREFVEQSESAPWGERSDFSSCILHDDTLIVCGGSLRSEYFSDVWKSKDMGRTWQQNSSDNPWGARSGMSLVCTEDGCLLLVGGTNDNQTFDDIWQSSDDGKTWTKVSTSVPWKPRHSSKLIQDPISHEILLLGGFNQSGEPLSDTWASVNGGITWVPRPHLPIHAVGDIVPIVNEEGILSVYSYSAANALMLYASISDLRYILRDSLILLLLGKRLEQKIPREIWISRIIPMALDTRTLWERRGTDWRKL